MGVNRQNRDGCSFACRCARERCLPPAPAPLNDGDLTNQVGIKLLRNEQWESGCAPTFSTWLIRLWIKNLTDSAPLHVDTSRAGAPCHLGRSFSGDFVGFIALEALSGSVQGSPPLPRSTPDTVD